MTSESSSARLLGETLGSRLTRARLAGRAVQLEQVVAVLRTRADYHAATRRDVPPPLTRALDDFERELHGVRKLLAESPHDYHRSQTS